MKSCIELIIMSLFVLNFYILVYANADSVKVTFKVTPLSMPPDSQIFITGNHKNLGNWNPGAAPLCKNKHGVWCGSFQFNRGVELEYKFTRGSWRSEAVNAAGIVPGNFYLKVIEDTTVQITIENWNDIIHKSFGQITGTVTYHRNMKGKGILPRDVIVWLPPDYMTAPEKRYPVLYMHDGQNIMDPKTAYISVDWQIDETADSLIKQQRLKEIIVVGIYNSEDRIEDYSDCPKGRAYMKFLVDDLKPFIDRTYRTLPQREHTAVMGSSMGGLISFLIAWNYSEIFSQAGCLSPAFVHNRHHSVRMVENYKGDHKPIRIYMDNGGIGLENELQPGCEAMLRALKRQGFTEGDNLQWYYDKDAAHDERAWAKRLWRPLLFMFGVD